MWLSLSTAQVIGVVAIRRIRKMAKMDLRSDWRRARRYSRIGVLVYEDLNARKRSGRVHSPSPESIKIARRIARNGGK